jgi:adenylyltransferase/sulfurtransferase
MKIDNPPAKPRTSPDSSTCTVKLDYDDQLQPTARAAANPTVTQLIDYQHFCGIAPETPEEKTMKNGIPQLTVKELKRRIDAGEDVFILDVREPYEYRIAHIGGKLIPQTDVPNRLAEIDRNREIIVQCRSGVRSQQVAEFLKQQGYPRVVNLAGGILAWADEIDPKMQKY